MLELCDLCAGYGETRVLHGVNLKIEKGEFHAVLGRNGVGKSTTLRTIVGLLSPMAGRVVFNGRDIAGDKPSRIVRAGIAYVPETRDIFGSLSVEENLRLTARLSTAPDRRWTVERVFDFFPNLANRRTNGGHQLSGGEQQMLAIGRALVCNPQLLVLDEPTEGLAPIVVRQIYDRLLELKREEAGMTMLLVEQNFQFATGLADAVTVFGRGQCVWQGTAEALRNDAETKEKWLGV